MTGYSNLSEEVRSKYGQFLDQAVQQVLDVMDEEETVEATVSALERLADEYTSQDVVPKDEHEVEDFFYQQFRLYDHDDTRVRAFHAIEDTVAYIFKGRLDYQEKDVEGSD